MEQNCKASKFTLECDHPADCPREDDPLRFSKLTPEQKQKYIAGAGNRCPFCDSDDIEGHGFETDSSGAWQPVECHTCGERWTDIYRLVDVGEIQ